MSDHLWKQCARWLCDLEVLPSDHRIVQPDTKIEDLAYTLRDGVVLYHILATIDPTSVNIKDINQRPQMARFLCLKNIRIFLTTCAAHFHLKESDLFEPSMLYDYTDFERVLVTLSKLSKCSNKLCSDSNFSIFQNCFEGLWARGSKCQRNFTRNSKFSNFSKFLCLETKIQKILYLLTSSGRQSTFQFFSNKF